MSAVPEPPGPVVRDRPAAFGRSRRARPAAAAGALVLVAAAAIAVHGCHRGGDRDDLVLWAMGSEGDAAAQLVREFERANPALHVRVQTLPWSAAHEKILTAFVGDSMPDAFQAGNTWLPELRELGAIDAIDARLDASATLDRADFFPGVLDTNVIEGVTWGLPWYVDTRLLFYRRDLLERAGVAEVPATWDAWRDAMTLLAEHPATADGHAILLPMREWEVPVILALGNRAELLRDHDRFGNFRSPPVRAAFAWYLDLFTRGLAPRASASTSGNLYQDFARGAFAYYVTGPWNLGELAKRLPAELAESWDTAPMPAARAGEPGLSLAGGASLVVSAKSARKDDAWRLIEFLAAPERQSALTRLTGDLPASRSAWTRSGLADAPRTRAFYAQLQSLRATPKIPEWEQIATSIARHAESMIRGEQTLDAGLADLDADVYQILAKRRWLLDRANAVTPAPVGSDAPSASTAEPHAP